MEPEEMQQLLKAVMALEGAMFKVNSLAEDLECGMSDEFCEKYPFATSFDEICVAVGLWRQNIERNLNEARVK